MHDWITGWFANGTFQAVYLVFLVALTVGPMIWLSRWYHRNIGTTAGGRRLQGWQNRHGVHGTGGLQVARDLERGVYGQDAKRLQHRVYRFMCLWLIAVAAFGGLAIWFMPSA